MSKYGLTEGTPDWRSAGAITFGPDNILFLADNAAARVYAVEIGDDAAADGVRPLDVDQLDARVAAHLGVERADVVVRGMAVHPTAHAVYLSVTRGHGAEALPVLVRIAPDGSVGDVPLVDVPFAQTEIGDAPSPDDERLDVHLDGLDDDSTEVVFSGVTLNMSRPRLRTSTVTDLAWIDGTLLLAGASNEEFSSALRRIPFPFGNEAETNSLEIFHVSHGKWETASPIRTFLPYDGNTSVLASYTCTPLVQFALTDLRSGEQAKGRTVAELGSMNQPLDMVSYHRDGQEYLLVSNTRHPLLKIATSSIDQQPALETPTEPVGVPREELPHDGVSFMANLDAGHVVMLQRDQSGGLGLHTYSTSSL